MVPELTPEAIRYYNYEAQRREAQKRRRPAWKTILVAGLLFAIPFGGAFIAIIYVYTHNNPQAFRPGAAWMSGWGALACFLIVAGLAVGGLSLLDSIAGNPQSAQLIESLRGVVEGARDIIGI